MRILDHLPIGALALIAASGSFTHIAHLAERSGQEGAMAWAVAVSIDLLAVVASLEIRRDKRLGKRPTVPVLVLSAAIVLTLAANLAEATPTVWGRICAGVPAGAFLLAVALLERRGGEKAEPEPEAEPEAAEPQPVIAVVPEPEPVRRTPKQAVKKSPAVPVADLLERARQVDQAHRASKGKPVSRDSLRAALGVSTNTASAVLRELRTA